MNLGELVARAKDNAEDWEEYILVAKIDSYGELFVFDIEKAEFDEEQGTVILL
jgi:hypothetical protein